MGKKRREQENIRKSLWSLYQAFKSTQRRENSTIIFVIFFFGKRQHTSLTAVDIDDDVLWESLDVKLRL